MERRDRGPALLYCERCKTFTRHQFTAEKSTRDPLFVQEIYRCACGEDRVWGLGYRPRAFEARRARPEPIAKVAGPKPSEVLAPVEG